MEPIAIYIHTPFCPSKCGYCDFNSYAMSGSIIEDTVNAICTEIRNSTQKDRPAKTIFFGGGTPTFLSEKQIGQIFDALIEAHPPIDDAEITSEANPGTVDIPKFGAMQGMGFNRISMGVQSFDPDDLTRLGRVHQVEHVYQAYSAARTAGFNNINLDLMFALENQSLQQWNNNLENAITLNPEHLSLYCLTIEPNTQFYKQQIKGLLTQPNDDLQVQMYDLAVDLTQKAGYHQYEISNFAKPAKECQHNLCYWNNEEYLGYGPGAVGCINIDGQKTRYTNIKHPRGYVKAIHEQSKLWCESDQLTAAQIKMEKIMLGLRLNRGLSIEGLCSNKLDGLQQRGWLELDGQFAKLTKQGKHFCSEAVLELC